VRYKKVCIYSGVSPSTTFIERLIVGLSETDTEILLVGRRHEEIKYNTQVHNATYKNYFAQFFSILRYYIPLSLKNKKLIGAQIKLQSSVKVKLKKLAEISIILWHKPDIFHIQWAKSIGEWIFLKEAGIKIVLSLRGAHINYSPIIDKNLANLYKQLFPIVDGFHGVSKAIIEEAQKYNLSTSSAKVVHSGLDLKKFEFNQKVFDRSQLNILSIGRVHWKKAYPLAIDVFNEFRNFDTNFNYTIIGGSGEDIIFQISQLKLNSHIKIIKKLPFGEVITMLQSANILLLPSYEEGIANVVLEAMALGVLVISSDCGGMSEVITDGENGFLFENRSRVGLLSKLILASQLTNTEYQRITLNARKTIEARFTEEEMVNGMMNLYDTVLGK